MKKIIRLIISVLACALITAAFAACGNNGTAGSNESGLVCKKYGDDEFYTVTRYYEEDGVSTLNVAEAFYNKYGREEKIGLIKKNAFKGNSSIKELIISETGDFALEIEEGAFAGMKALEKITLPFVGAFAESDATIMQTAPAEKKATDKARSIGYIFGEEEMDNSSPVTLTYGKDSATFYIPSTLYEITVKASEKGINIPMYAFCGLKQVSKVNLEGNILAIGDSAFKDMTKLAKVNIPASVKVIYDSAFSGATALKEFGTDFKFNDGSALEEIKDGAFKGTKIASFTLPENVKAIGESCFAENAFLTEFNFNAGIETVGAYAFYNCSKLSSVNGLPNAAVIGVNAFEGTLAQ